MSSLSFSLIQSDLVWEDKLANLTHFSTVIAHLPASSQVVILPEMFSTGFSMNPEKLAEPMNGDTVLWMKEEARKNKKIITGSIIIEEKNQYFNRLMWMQPDGNFHYYDKRHLFAFANEHQHYQAGNKRVIVQVNGLKICLQICYDLRFPVWARQNAQPYDVLIYVANWPERRIHAWKTLLQARAIENQCYVLGVNRIGHDGNNIYHNGASSIINPLGEILWQSENQAESGNIAIHRSEIEQMRNQFPFLKDADQFHLL